MASKPARRGAPGGKAKSRAAKSSKGAAQAQAAKLKLAKARALQKEQEQKKVQARRELERQKKAREREQAEARAEKKKRDALVERKQKEKEREKASADRERERLKKEREKLQQKKAEERERALALKAKEAERAKKEKERLAERALALKAKEAERAEQKKAKEAERLRKIAERDAEREAVRRLKEEERARKDLERETYRKAKEAERERVRAEREAARRALEGKVSRANKRAQRADGSSRGGTTRVYRPDAIPNQAGTTRRTESGHLVLTGVRPADIARDVPRTTVAAAPTPTPPPPPPPPLSVEERWASITERLKELDQQFQHDYRESFEMSWIHHDGALEGVVYTFQELRAAIDPNITAVSDSGLQPACDEIRRHRQAIECVRDLSERKRVPITVDTIKKIYCILHPEEGDVKTVKYRKDIPQHRLYFHEYAAPDKIAYKVRQVVDWLNGPEPKKLKSPIRVAARVHYDLLRVFPFPQDSGKVARLLMNVLLMRAGHPPAIIHSTERQRYYEALKGQLPVIVAMVNESIMNALLSIEKKIEEYDAGKAKLATPPPAPEESA